MIKKLMVLTVVAHGVMHSSGELKVPQDFADFRHTDLSQMHRVDSASLLCNIAGAKGQVVGALGAEEAAVFYMPIAVKRSWYEKDTNGGPWGDKAVQWGGHARDFKESKGRFASQPIGPTGYVACVAVDYETGPKTDYTEQEEWSELRQKIMRAYESVEYLAVYSKDKTFMMPQVTREMLQAAVRNNPSSKDELQLELNRLIQQHADETCVEPCLTLIRARHAPIKPGCVYELTYQCDKVHMVKSSSALYLLGEAAIMGITQWEKMFYLIRFVAEKAHLHEQKGDAKRAEKWKKKQGYMKKHCPEKLKFLFDVIEPHIKSLPKDMEERKGAWQAIRQQCEALHSSSGRSVMEGQPARSQELVSRDLIPVELSDREVSTSSMRSSTMYRPTLQQVGASLVIAGSCYTIYKIHKGDWSWQKAKGYCKKWIGKRSQTDDNVAQYVLTLSR